MRKLKNVLCAAMAFLMATALCVGCGGKSSEENKKQRIVFISCYALDSSEWLQNLVKGLQEYEGKHENVEIKCMEALSPDQYETKVRTCCEEGFDIVITSYADMADATTAVSKDYPDTRFGILQGEIPNIEDYPNIQDFHLNRTETGFLQGCAAALMTKTGKVGFVGGADIGSINEILAGWQQGIAYMDNGTEDLVAYCNSFTDPTAGKEYAMQLIAGGCDVIFGAAGGSGTGCAQAAEEQGAMFAACDVHYPDVAPTMEIGSALNYFENMVVTFIDDAVNGNYQGGTSSEYGIAQGAAAYEFAGNGLVPEDIQKQVMDISSKIGKGEIEISTEPLHK